MRLLKRISVTFVVSIFLIMTTLNISVSALTIISEEDPSGAPTWLVGDMENHPDDGYVYPEECIRYLQLYHDVSLGNETSPWRFSFLVDWNNTHNPLTREEALTYIIQSFGIAPLNEPDHIWADEESIQFEYRPYIDYAYRLGITGGTGNNHFSPKSLITDSQFLALLTNAHNVKDELIPTFNMTYESGYSQIASYKCQESMFQMPIEIMNLFDRLGWTLNIRDYQLYGSDGEAEPSWAGVTIYAYKKIDIKVTHQMDTTVIHEFGHFVQDVTNTDIQMEMNEEVDNLARITGSYCRTNDHEYFAEAFQAYYTKNGQLLEYCPKTYQVVEEAIDKIITREHRENTIMYY